MFATNALIGSHVVTSSLIGCCRHDAVSTKQSGSSAVSHTLAWMAPELIDHGAISPRADVYSYAIILWQMLTRAELYPGLSTYEVSHLIHMQIICTYANKCKHRIVEVCVCVCVSGTGDCKAWPQTSLACQLSPNSARLDQHLLAPRCYVEATIQGQGQS